MMTEKKPEEVTISPTTFIQGIHLRCAPYAKAKTRQGGSKIASLGGDIFQIKVNSFLKRTGLAIDYIKDFLTSVLNLEINKTGEIPPINSDLVLRTIVERKESLKTLIDKKGKIYVFRTFVVGYSTYLKNGIPIEISEELKELSRESDERIGKLGFLDLIYLTFKDDKIVIGAGEIKLAENKQDYHTYQAILYLRALLRKVKKLGLENEIKVSSNIELFYPTLVHKTSEEKPFVKEIEDVSNIDLAFESFKKEVELTNSFKKPPVGPECYICKNILQCLYKVLEENLVPAYKSLKACIKDLYSLGFYNPKLVLEKAEKLVEENSIKINISYLRNEIDWIEKNGWWRAPIFENSQEHLPKVERYHKEIPSFEIDYENFISIYAHQSLVDIFDLNFFSITFLTKKEKILKNPKEFIEKFAEKTKFSPETIEWISIGDYAGFILTGYRCKGGSLLKDIFIKTLTYLFWEVWEKGKKEIKTFIGYVDRASRETTKRVFLSKILNVARYQNEKYFNFLDFSFPAIILEDKSAMYYDRQNRGGILLNKLEWLFRTNEPFILSYPSLLAITQQYFQDFIPSKFSYTLAKINSKDSISPIETNLEKGNLELDIKDIYETIALPNLLIDISKLDKEVNPETGLIISETVILPGNKKVNYDVFNPYLLNINTLFKNYMALISFLPLAILIADKKKLS